MEQILDLDRYPLHQPDELDALVTRCRTELDRHGMFNLESLVRPAALEDILAGIDPIFGGDSFTHAREHNIYFRDELDELPADHPALRTFTTINHTLCGDQVEDSPLDRIYRWPPLRAFLARVMDIPNLFEMADPLARLNVMQYRDGEALNWHFDRSEFTTTLLLQSAERGGEFQYRSGLRSDTDPNFDGVGAFLSGDQSDATTLTLAPGTLNVFRGRNTAHRVTPVEGSRHRIVAVFSYYDRPGVLFSPKERQGFYGRVE